MRGFRWPVRLISFLRGCLSAGISRLMADYRPLRITCCRPHIYIKYGTQSKRPDTDDNPPELF